MDDCYHCGFYDYEAGGCTCPHYDRWYAGACATATEDDFIEEEGKPDESIKKV